MIVALLRQNVARSPSAAVCHPGAVERLRDWPGFGHSGRHWALTTRACAPSRHKFQPGGRAPTPPWPSAADRTGLRVAAAGGCERRSRGSGLAGYFRAARGRADHQAVRRARRRRTGRIRGPAPAAWSQRLAAARAAALPAERIWPARGDRACPDGGSDCRRRRAVSSASPGRGAIPRRPWDATGFARPARTTCSRHAGHAAGGCLRDSAAFGGVSAALSGARRR